MKSDKTVITVMSANLWGRNGPSGWEGRRDMVVRCISPNISNKLFFLAIQEADLSPGKNTLIELAGRLGYKEEHTGYVPGTGVGFITNGEIIVQTVYNLPDKDGHPLNFGRRIALIAVCEFEGKKAVFACTHITVNPEMQKGEVELLEHWTSRMAESEGLPVVILGDMNFDPSTDPYYHITGPAPMHLGYIDAMLGMQRKHAYTWPVAINWYRHRTIDPNFRKALARWVDHIFVKDIEVVRSFITSSKRQKNGYPSDHKFVGAVLRF